LKTVVVFVFAIIVIIVTLVGASSYYSTQPCILHTVVMYDVGR
jgi:hypothetical protein